MPEDNPTVTLAAPVRGSDAAVIVETAQAAADPNLVVAGELYSVVVPEGATLETLDLEKFSEAPRRLRGTSRPMTVESFIDAVKPYNGSFTSVWIHPTSGHIEAVLNDHGDGEPGWGDHRAVLDLIPTEEWKFWLGKDGHIGTQQEFVEHVEDGIKEIVEPDAATMLELAQSIQAKTQVSFRSATRVENGEVQMAYDEEVDAKAGRKGQLTIPSTFTLAIAPFVGEGAYKVVARLRYRINGGQLRIGYRLERPDAIVRDALEKIAERLQSEFSNVYIGTPAGTPR